MDEALEDGGGPAIWIEVSFGGSGVGGSGWLLGLLGLRWTAAAAEVDVCDGHIVLAACAVDAIYWADTSSAEVVLGVICCSNNALCFGFGCGVVPKEFIVCLW